LERGGHSGASKEEPGTRGRRHRWAGPASLGLPLVRTSHQHPLPQRSGGGTTFSRSRRGRERRAATSDLEAEGAPHLRRRPPPPQLLRGRGRPPELPAANLGPPPRSWSPATRRGDWNLVLAPSLAPVRARLASSSGGGGGGRDGEVWGGAPGLGGPLLSPERGRHGRKEKCSTYLIIMAISFVLVDKNVAMHES
jgi:hypothetical protein